MAKKDSVDFDDLSLDDIDFGGDFDFNTDGEIKFDADDDRSPIETFVSSAKDGLKDRIMDRGLIRRLLSFALPKGYSQAFNAYDSLSNGVADIYKDNAAEMQPYMQKTSRFLKQQNPMFKRLLPKGAREALDASEHEEDSWGSSQEDKLSSDINGIDKLLGMEARNKLDENISDARRDVRARKEFQTTTGISLEMGKSIGRLVEYQDSVLINYHRKSLELKYRHLDVSMRTHHASEVFHNDALDLLKAIGKNSALPDFLKMRNTEIVKERLRHRLADNIIGSASNFAKKHLGSIKENLSQSLGGALGALGAANAMGGNMSKSAMAGEALGGLASEGLADLLEFAVKEGLTKMGLGKQAGMIQDGGRFLQDKLSGLSQRVNDYARSDTTSTGLKSTFEMWAKRQLDSYTITDKINGGGVYALDETAKFDNLFHKTVVEIIPGQLSSMEKWLRTIATGQEQEEHAYSHYTGGFVTRDVLNQQHVDIGLKAGAGDAVRKQLDYQLKDMGAEELSPKAKRALRSRLMTDMSSNRDFDPRTLVKPESWTNAGPDVAEELVEFFAEKYGIGMDGKYVDDDEDAKALRTKARAGYLDLAPRITDYTSRMAGLSEVIGRRSWRELGLSKYDGRNGDTIDTNAIYDKIANEGGDEFVDDRKEEEKPEDFTWSAKGLKDGINARADLARKKMLEKEAEQKRKEEEAAKAAEGLRVDVDAGKTTAGGGPGPAPTPIITPVVTGQFSLDPISINLLTTTLSDVLAQQGAGQWEMTLPELLETVDKGTHDRLDAILAAVQEIDPCGCEGRSPGARVDFNLAENAATARDYVTKRYNDANLPAKWDMARGYVTDRYDEFGMPERIDQARNYVEGKLDEHNVKGRLTDARDKAVSKYHGLDIPGRIAEARNLAQDQWDQFDAQGRADAARKRVEEWDAQGKLRALTDKALVKYDEFDARGKTEGLRDQAFEKIEELRAQLEDFDVRGRAEGLKDKALGKIEDFDVRGKAEGLRDKAREAYDEFDPRGAFDRAKEFVSNAFGGATEGSKEYWDRMREVLAEELHRAGHVGGGGEGQPQGEAAPPKSRGIGGRIWGAAKKAPGKALRGLGSYLGWSYRTIGAGVMGAGKLGVAGAKLPFTAINGLGVSDVHVQGETEPALTAKNIRRGYYFDVNTKKVIEKLKDITGPVKNREGEFVLTQEEFDKGLMSGDGESLAGWVGRKGIGAGLGLAGLAGRYVRGSYGLMGKAMKGAFNLAYDQFVQFDAYFPGDEEPRIRSSLLKKGFYRDKDGAPLKSLKDITGPVFDIEDNEVISQEDLDKYKSLYTRNGSLLFTVGRGLVSGTAWAGDLALRGVKGYARMAGKFYKGLWKGAKAIGRGVKSMGMGLAGKMGFKSDSPEAVAAGGMYGGDEELHTAVFEVGIQQLNTQRSIFELLREKFKMEQRDKWDLDGDGDRDNSWNDILKRRKAKKEEKEYAKQATGNNADVVKAIDKLGKNLDAALDELGDRVEESAEDGLLDQAADLGNIAEGWGGDGAGEGRGRRGRRGARGGRGGRLGRAGGKLKGLGGRIAGSRAAGWAVRGGTMAVEGAMGVGSAIMGSSMMAGLGTAAAAAGTTAMGWLGAGAAAVGSVLSAPVILAAAAIAAVGYVGYKWYKSSQAKDNPIFYLRMTQYGVAPTDETRVKQMLAMEELLLPAVTFSGEKANIDAAKVSIPKLMEILEIEEGEDKRLKWALKWLSQRFRPVFLAHVGAMKKTVKSTKLSEADQLIDGSVIKEFLEIVDLKNFEKIYNAILESPFDSTMGFGGSLDCGASDVEDAFALVRDRIKETEKKPEAAKSQDAPKDPEAEGGELGKAVAAVGAGAAGVIATQAGKTKRDEGEPLDIGGYMRSGIDPTAGAGPLAAAAAGVAMTALPLPPGGPVSKEVDGATVSTAPKTAEQDPSMVVRLSDQPARAADPLSVAFGVAGSLLKSYYQVQASKVKAYSASLDIPMAVRFLEYGLTSFDDEKCKQLQQVEDLYWDFLKFNGFDNALIDGDLSGLEDTVIGIFTPTGGIPQNVVMWLRYRFMPTFLQYAISVRRRLPGDVRQAPRNLTSQLMRDVLIETTQAVDSDAGTLVWLNMPSPWPNYVLGKDASVATPYIEGLPKSLKERVVEGLKDMASPLGMFGSDEPPIAKSNLYQGSPNQVKEEGGLFSNAASSVKKFFGFGSDPGGTAAGTNTSSGGQSGMSAGTAGPGGLGVGGPAVGSVGAQVSHPGGGTGGDINTLPTTSGDGWEAMKGIIVGAAKMAGFDPFISANVAAVESQFKPRAGAGTSSAKGLYQFVNGTWGDMLRKYGKKYGIASNTHQFDPRANALMGMEYLKENYAYLKEKAKVPVTDTALYAAHFLGAYGAKKFLTAPGAANSEDIVGSAAVKANASVFREPTGRKGVYGRVRTVAEALAEIDRRMQAARAQHDLKPGQQPVVAEGSENQAAENRPQNGEGETGGAAPDIGMDTAAAQGGGAPTADAPGESGGSAPMATSSGGGGGGSEGAVSNASNGMPTGASGAGTSYSQPPSPDAGAAAASGNAVLTREPDDDQGTFGILRLPDGTEFCTLELPWRGNATGASCIPPGTYQVAMRNSPKFGQIYEVQNVPGRTAILIHSGNVAGDESKGYNSHVEGCILLGLSKGKVGGQKAVQQSRAAVAQFNEKMAGRPFTMSVIGAGANTSAKSVGDAPAEEGATNATGSPVSAQDVAESANGAASGSSAAVNTQQGPAPTGNAAQDSAGTGSSTGSPLAPTISQSTANQNQNSMAQSTAELSTTVGPLLQQQLEVQKSMDSSLSQIRQYLEAMSKQQPASQGQPEAMPGSKDGQRQWSKDESAGTPPEATPRATPTSTGSGRNPINTRRTNAVT